MDRLLSFEIFVAAVEAGSFAAVAERFDITSAMVGKHVKKLEEQAGARLLERSTRRQSLTEIGEEYFRGCKKILAEYAALECRASAYREAPRGILRINAPVTFGSLVLAPLVCDFLDLYQGVQVDLDLSDRKVDVMHDPFDLVFRIGDMEDADYVARKVDDYAMVFCAAPAYLNRCGVPASTAELNRHQCLGFSFWGKQSRLTADLDTRAFDSRVSRFRASSGAALKAAALRGWGVLLQPRVLVAAELSSGALVEILPDQAPAPRPVHLLYRSRKSLPAKTRLFIDFIAVALIGRE